MSNDQAERAIAAGEVQVSPAELATLMRNPQVQIAIFDLRDEPAFTSSTSSMRGAPPIWRWFARSPRGR